MKITPELQLILGRFDYGWRVYIDGRHIKTGVSVITYFDSYEVLPNTLILQSSLYPSIHTCLGNLVESNDLFFRIEQKDSWSNAILQFNWENPKLMASIEALNDNLKQTTLDLENFIEEAKRRLNSLEYSPS